METAKSMLPFARRNGYEAYLRTQAAQNGLLWRGGPPVGAPLTPRVNHGRWIIDCPDCPGAQYADPEEPIFFCLACGNLGTDGRPRRVSFPRDRNRIEGRLRDRALEYRNWFVGEAIEELEAENIRHGLRPRPEEDEVTEVEP